LNCPWHPNKRVVSSCKDCGTGFCIECVRETDQTTLCPDCYRRKLGEIAREFTEPDEEARAPGAAAVSSLPREEMTKQAQPAEAAKQVEPVGPSPFDDEMAMPAVAKGKKKKAVRKRGRDKRVEAPPEPPVPPSDDFLSQGPDEDFSQITAGTTRLGRRPRQDRDTTPPPEEIAEAPVAEDAAAVPPEQDAVAAPPVEDTAAVPPAGDIIKEPPPKGPPQAKAAIPSEDRLLQDVMSTLLRPEAVAAPQAAAMAMEKEPEEPEELAQPSPATPTTVRAAPRARPAQASKAAVRRERRAERALTAKERTSLEKDTERWSFLSQPRSSQYTLIATSWWRATLFIALMLLLGALLWAVPNAFIPGDEEYGIHAVLVGLVLGLAFWWKAGKKHSTKLAVQAALTTFFALFIGEFLHWFLTIIRFEAFRTIFFDLVSFKFLWENGADILKYTMEAMFPVAFLWLLLLPAVTAFIVGFGLPPIPEILFQIWHALRGREPETKEASHGLEG
jgi:hypothetical protein